jgi:hypothetical protein
MELFEKSLFHLLDSNPDIPGHILIATPTRLSRVSLSRIISEGEVVRVPAMKCYVPVEVQLHLFFPYALDGNLCPGSHYGPFKLVEDHNFLNE